MRFTRQSLASSDLVSTSVPSIDQVLPIPSPQKSRIPYPHFQTSEQIATNSSLKFRADHISPTATSTPTRNSSLVNISRPSLVESLMVADVDDGTCTHTKANPRRK